jgi:hypothetical protein
MKIITMLPWLDWLALFTFFGLWVGYAWLAKVRGLRDQTLIATTNRTGKCGCCRPRPVTPACWMG